VESKGKGQLSVKLPRKTTKVNGGPGGIRTHDSRTKRLGVEVPESQTPPGRPNGPKLTRVRESCRPSDSSAAGLPSAASPDLPLETDTVNKASNECWTTLPNAWSFAASPRCTVIERELPRTPEATHVQLKRDAPALETVFNPRADGFSLQSAAWFDSLSRTSNSGRRAAFSPA